MSTTLHTGQPAPGTTCGRPVAFGDAERLLQQFDVLPMRFADRELLIHFKRDHRLYRLEARTSRALDLPLGDTACCTTYLSSDGADPGAFGFFLHLYAVGSVAEELLALPGGTLIRARGKTIFGLGEDEKDSDKQIGYSGLLLLDLLNTYHPAPDAGP